MRMEVVKCVLVRECRVYLNYLESDKVQFTRDYTE